MGSMAIGKFLMPHIVQCSMKMSLGVCVCVWSTGFIWEKYIVSKESQTFSHVLWSEIVLRLVLARDNFFLAY